MDANRPRPPKVKLDELLLRHGAITAEQLAKAHAEQKKWGGELGPVLVELGFISEPLLMKAYAHLMGISASNPAVDPIPVEFVQAVGVQVCEQYGVIPIGGDLKKKKLIVATSQPTRTHELQAVAKLTGFQVVPAAAPADAIEKAIRKHYYGESLAPGAQATPRPQAPPPPAGSAATGEELLRGLRARLELLERKLEPLEPQLALLSNPEFAGLTSRVERLEQLVASESNLIRALGELMVEKKLLTREELFAKVIR